MHATRLAFFLSAFAAACSSSSPEPEVTELPELAVSGSCRHHEDTLILAIAVANRGRGAAAPSTTRVEFNGDPASGVVHQTRFIPARAVDSFELELPELCSKIACRWKITVDSVQESGRC